MKVFDPSVDCNQVRSVLVFVDLNNYAEVGYFEDPSGAADQCQTFSTPHPLVYAVQGTTVKCKQNPVSLTAGQFYKVRVQNPNHDNTFEYYRGTSSEGSYSVNFTSGNVRSFTERHGNGESLHADMDGLAYMNSLDTWFNWTDQSHASTGGLSPWNFCEVSEYHYKVVNTSC